VSTQPAAASEAHAQDGRVSPNIGRDQARSAEIILFPVNKTAKRNALFHYLFWLRRRLPAKRVGALNFTVISTLIVSISSGLAALVLSILATALLPRRLALVGWPNGLISLGVIAGISIFGARLIESIQHSTKKNCPEFDLQKDR
jgi:hypothetical protein